MKKTLFAFLAAAFVLSGVLPSFAAGNEIVIKAGIQPLSVIYSEVETKGYLNGLLYSENNNSESYNGDFGFSLGIDYVSFIGKNLGIGGGLSYFTQRSIKTNDPYFDDPKADAANVYAIFKIKTNNLSKTSNLPVFLYGIINLGIGYLNTGSYDEDEFNEYMIQTTGISGDTSITDNPIGLYFGAGAGAEINSFIIEILYSLNFTSTEVKFSTYVSGDLMKITAVENDVFGILTLRVGYKFSL